MFGRACVLCLTLVALAVPACGPITSSGEIGRAQTALDAAHAANAEQYAPYWWTRASEYLRKAREVAGHADYQAANRFGRLATEAANLAEQQAVVAGKDRARHIAPAKDQP